MFHRFVCSPTIPFLFYASIVCAADEGMLYVKSEPSGATIFIDGEERGTTPAFIRHIEPGRRVVELRLLGGPAAKQILTVEAGKIARLNVKLDETAPSGQRRGPDRAAPVPERTEREPDTVADAGDKFVRILGEFETLIERGDYVGARRLAKRGASQSESAETAVRLRAAAKVASALEDRREAIRSGARALVGQDLTLQTKAGPRKGKVEKVTDDGIALAAQIRAGGRVVGTTSFTLPWSDLAPVQEELLARGWDRGSADARIARAFLALARRDLAAAGRAVHGTPGHPLAEYVRGRMEAVKRAPSEAAARKAWGEIEKLLEDPDRSAAEARKLLAMLDSFERRHGRTEHAMSVKAGIAEAREAIRLAPARAVGAPADAVGFNGHWYKLFDQRVTWHEAKSFCKEQGGHLVTITSKGENEFVTDLARKAGTDAWIGLTDEKQEGRWEWVTGEKVGFTAWAPLQPDNMDGVQHYVRLWRRHAFAWDDDRASGHVGPTPFICEWDSTVRKPPRIPDRVARAFEAPPGQPVETETIGGRGGGRFRELPQERSILVGFKLWVSRFRRNTIIKALQAIYLTRTGETRGQIRGQPAGKETTVVARPGFAAGALEGRGGARVNGFRIVFMRMEGAALDSSKWYASEWIGGQGGGPERRLGGRGKYVVGIHGGSGSDVDRIGLITDR